MWMIEQLKLGGGESGTELPNWVIGRQYPVIDNQLYFMSVRDERKLEEVVQAERRSGKQSRVFFTIDNKLVYLPFCADFGPLHIGWPTNMFP